MNWHETINHIRNQPEYAELVKQAYFDEDLILNIERFGESEEFAETLRIINQYSPEGKSVLDIGAGNGVSSINFALKGFDVTVIEPDSSDMVGANAIRILKEHYSLSSMPIFESYAEDLALEENSFDHVYIRQAMHHARDLKKFIAECARVLKPGGILITVRDHVVYDDKDKKWFLKTHPLHKYYGGENAFTSKEYMDAMSLAGLFVLEELKYFDSVINYFPASKNVVENNKIVNDQLKQELRKKIGPLSDLDLIFKLYKLTKGKSGLSVDEKQIPGRMYSYISKKAISIVMVNPALVNILNETSNIGPAI
jgi:ubiquinone/menaquinone biosynthesis C-methylase UbiE